MPLVLDHPHLTDTLRYRVLARKVLPQGDVKMAVPVIALVQAGDRDQAALEKRIREALESVVAAKWGFSHIVREADATGYERVRLVAMARVGAAENWNLVSRAFDDRSSLDAHVAKVCERLKYCAPVSLRWHKECLRALWQGSLTEGEAVEARAVVDAMDEGVWFKPVEAFFAGKKWDYMAGKAIDA